MPSQASLTLPRPLMAGKRGLRPDTAAALIMEAAREIRDPSVTEDRIMTLLNRTLLEVSGRVRLPDLMTENTVLVPVGAASAEMPADYHHGLTEVVCLTSRRRVRLAGGVGELERLGGPDRGGYGPCRIRAAAVAGNRLYVRPRPTAPALLLVRYQRLPAILEADTDRPDGLPVHLAPELLLSRVLRDLYEGLEEGGGGDKIQTGRYQVRFEAAMDRLGEFVGDVQALDVPVPDVLGFERLEGLL